jgi:hypothetical protein
MFLKRAQIIDIYMLVDGMEMGCAKEPSKTKFRQNEITDIYPSVG